MELLVQLSDCWGFSPRLLITLKICWLRQLTFIEPKALFKISHPPLPAIMGRLNVSWINGKPCDRLALCSTPCFGASCFLMCCQWQEWAGKVWRGRCLPSTSALLCEHVQSKTQSITCQSSYFQLSLGSVNSLSGYIADSSDMALALRERCLLLLCDSATPVTVSGTARQAKGEGETAGASRLLLGAFKCWHVSSWEVCDRQFSCDLDPESLRKSETFLKTSWHIKEKSIVCVGGRVADFHMGSVWESHVMPSTMYYCAACCPEEEVARIFSDGTKQKPPPNSK